MTSSPLPALPRSVCCTGCFRDPIIRAKIRDEGREGTCPWCGTLSVKVLQLGELTDMFRNLVEQYVTPGSHGHGEELDFLLDDGWQIFDDRLLEGGGRRRAELLVAILKYGYDPKDDVDNPDYRQVFVVRGSSPVDLLGQWVERVEAQAGTSPAPAALGPTTADGDGDKSFDFIADAIETAGSEFTIRRPHFRARIHTDRSSSALIPLASMGAPQASSALEARANRAGEPVLYLAKGRQTALAEVRAWKGAVVAIAQMRLIRPLRILNLVKLPHFGSPFQYEELSWALDARALLRELGRELSRPLIPGEEATGYRPSQHACDIARRVRFDGVAYPSAMGPGHNVVLFDVLAAVPESVSYYRILRPTFSVADYPYADMRWEGDRR